MASLRLLCIPNNNNTETQFHSHISASSTFIMPRSCSFPNSLKLAKTINNNNTNFLLHFSAIPHDQAQALESSPPVLTQSEELESDYKDRFRLYAQNVPWDYTPQDIRALFDKYGTVVGVELSMYNKTKNRGLAFVTMGSPEEALAALNNLQSYEVEGRVLTLDYAKPRKNKFVQPKPEVTFNLFVANLSFEARAKDLRELFTNEGHSVVSAQVIFYDENPRGSLGYGFVCFKSKKEAEAARTSVQGKLFMGRPIRIELSRKFVKQSAKESTTECEEDTSLELSSGIEV
ncbi:28 kDa ribonucleoprotein, chloroplastic-like [Humulus lupulus]|uniref:28 kDa ribonucleoprotein, chloroplastic-like n=1 Tax=Humulus lupulus TaxID=3486 RepID=UPI002B40BD2A|nr:28 kDa ribonucleoprotein, chloroplastic-like [Humulus lupulus]XP_062101392.1 28 kDa ribonucleoprotein, chloroplastic-like [Humulus lupulus]